jgi:flagellar basal-body rod protein FlgB
MNFLNKTEIPILSKALSAYSLRHEVISSNIANIGTPGYKSKSVEFENTLQNALTQTGVQLAGDPELGHIPLGGVVQQNGSAVVENNFGELQEDQLKSGINDVDIDVEMAEMAKNQIRFKYASRLLTISFQEIQKSIKGTI